MDILNTSPPSRKSSIWSVIELLAAKFPQTFFVFEQRRKPLKIGIREDLVAALGDTVPAQSLHDALRAYTSNRCYRHSLQPNARRYDLSGEECGRVTKEEAEHALKKKQQKPPPVPRGGSLKPKGDGLAALRTAGKARLTMEAAVRAKEEAEARGDKKAAVLAGLKIAALARKLGERP